MAGHYDVTVTSEYNMLSLHHVIFLDICVSFAIINV